MADPGKVRRTLGRRLREAIDASLCGVAHLSLNAFFRQIEVAGASRLGAGPMLLVANHENNLIDPLLLMGFLGVRPRLLAKSTLWSHPVMAPLVRLAGALPAHRRQDGADMAQNVATFDRCREFLKGGGVVALFPEGTSHNEPHRLPLKTGAARIALEAMATGDAPALRIVPVGLNFEAKARFRSRVLVQVGEPIDPAPEAARWAADPVAAVRELTARVTAGLEAVTLNYASWDEARLVARAASLLSGADGPEGAGLADTWRLRKRILAGHHDLQRADPAQAERLLGEVSRYDRLLARVFEPDEPQEWVELAPRPEERMGPLGLALVGLAALLNWLPYRLPDWLSTRMARTADEPATYKLLAGLLLFPLAWTLEALVAARLFGSWVGLAVALAGPLSARATLRWLDRRYVGEAWRHAQVRLGETALRQLLGDRARLQRELATAAERRSPPT